MGLLKKTRGRPTKRDSGKHLILDNLSQQKIPVSAHTIMLGIKKKVGTKTEYDYKTIVKYLRELVKEKKVEKAPIKTKVTEKNYYSLIRAIT